MQSGLKMSPDDDVRVFLVKPVSKLSKESGNCSFNKVLVQISGREKSWVKLRRSTVSFIQHSLWQEGCYDMR